MINDAYMRTSFLLKTVGYNTENKAPVELIKRRKRAQTLNMLSIFFISVATLFSIHLISTFQATQSVPVAIRNIAKGSVIKQSDLHYVNVPKSSVFNNVLNQTSINNSAKNAIIAACNIKYGTPIFSNQVTKQTKINFCLLCNLIAKNRRSVFNVARSNNSVFSGIVYRSLVKNIVKNAAFRHVNVMQVTLFNHAAFCYVSNGYWHALSSLKR